jgi:hypothetical protein
MFVASRPDGTVRFSTLAPSMALATDQGRITLSAPKSLPGMPVVASWTRPWRTSFLYVRVAPFRHTGTKAAVLLAAECAGSTCATANFRVMYDNKSVMLAYGRYPTCNSGAVCVPVTPADMRQYGATVVVSVVELAGVRVVSMSVIVNCSVVARYESDRVRLTEELGRDPNAAPQLVPSNPATTASFTVVAHAAVTDVALLAHNDALDDGGNSGTVRVEIEHFLYMTVPTWISIDPTFPSGVARDAAYKGNRAMAHLFRREAALDLRNMLPQRLPTGVRIASVTMKKVVLSVGQAADGCWRATVTAAPMTVPPQRLLVSPLRAPMLLAWRTAAGGFSMCANTDSHLVSARPAVDRGEIQMQYAEIQMQYAAAGYSAPLPWRTCHLVVRVMPVTVTGTPTFALLTMGAAMCVPGAPCALTTNVPSFQLRYDAVRECLLFGGKARTMCVRVPKARVEEGLAVIVSCATRGGANPSRRVTLAAGDGTYHSVLLAPGEPDFIPPTLVSNGKFLVLAGMGVSHIALIAHHGQTDDASRRDIERFFAEYLVPQPVLGFLRAAVTSAHISQPAYNNVNSCCPTVGLSAIRPAGKPTDKWPGFSDIVAKSRFLQ